MTNEEKITALREIKDLVENHPVLNPANVAENVFGHNVYSTSSDAIRWCFLGAIWKTIGDQIPWDRIEIERLTARQPAMSRVNAVPCHTKTLADGNAGVVCAQAIAELECV